MSVESDLFDFENIIPTAVASVFTDGGFTAANALTSLSDPKFQKERARVEIIFKVTGEVFPQRYAIMNDGSVRNAAWKGQLSVVAITAADAAGKITHGEYRAKVRNFCANLRDRVNSTALTKHKLQQVLSGPTTVGIRAKDGYEQSTLDYAVEFSIQGDAWAALVPPVSPPLSPPFLTVNFPGYSIYWYGADGQAPTIELLTSAENASVDFSSADHNTFVIAASLNDAQFYDTGQGTASASVMTVACEVGGVDAAHTVVSAFNPDLSSAEILADSGSLASGTYVGGDMDFTGTPFEGLGTASITF